MTTINPQTLGDHPATQRIAHMLCIHYELLKVRWRQYLSWDLVKITAVLIGMLLAIIAVSSASWVWLRKQLFGFGGSALCASGVVFIGLSIWSNINITVSPSEGLRLRLSELETAISTIAAQNKTLAEGVGVIEVKLADYSKQIKYTLDKFEEKQNLKSSNPLVANSPTPIDPQPLVTPTENEPSSPPDKTRGLKHPNVATDAGNHNSPGSADWIIAALRPSGNLVSGSTRGIRLGAPAAPSRATSVAPRSMVSPSAASPSVNLTLNFPTGSAYLTPAARASLDALGKALVSDDLANFHFRIEGHTDTVGSREDNLSLSQRRADSVISYLVSQYQINPNRLVAVGMGQESPLVDTPPQTPEPRNRRVAIINLGSS